MPRRRWKVVALLADRQWYTWARCYTEWGARRRSKRLTKSSLSFMPVSAVIAGIGYIHEDEELPAVLDVPLDGLDGNDGDGPDSDERLEQP